MILRLFAVCKCLILLWARIAKMPYFDFFDSLSKHLEFKAHNQSWAFCRSRCSHNYNRDRHTYSEKQMVGQGGEGGFNAFGRPPAKHT